MQKKYLQTLCTVDFSHVKKLNRAAVPAGKTKVYFSFFYSK